MRTSATGAQETRSHMGTPCPGTAPPTENRTAAYVAPFATYIGVMGLERILHAPLSIGYSVRILSASCAICLLSRPILPRRAMRALASVLIGVGVFLIWIGPDVLFGYRHSWLFENPITGMAVSSVPQALKRDWLFICCRLFGCVVVVPIVEELFWRGWLMRWLITQRFESVPLGTYGRGAFWIVAVLFASEHGSYWEVGLAAGIVYNLWMIRTKNLADCMIAHAVTNALLSIYALIGGHWEYWY